MFLASCKPPPFSLSSGRSAQLFRTYPFSDERTHAVTATSCLANHRESCYGSWWRMTFRANSPGSTGCRSLRSQYRPPAQKLSAYFLVSEGWKHTWGTHADRAGLSTWPLIAIDRVVLDLKAGCWLLQWKAGEWIGVGGLYRLIDYIVVSSWLGSIGVHWSCCAVVAPRTAAMQGCL